MTMTLLEYTVQVGNLSKSTLTSHTGTFTERQRVLRSQEVPVPWCTLSGATYPLL